MQWLYGLTIEVKISFASAVAAIASAIYAWRGVRIARRALHIAELDHKERHAGLSAYLVEGRICSTDASGEFVSFACSISNAASAPLSVTRADLHLHAFDQTGRTSEIILQPAQRSSPVIWESPEFELPLNLDARSTVSGWLGYKIPERVAQTLSIDKYEISIQTSTGEHVSLESYLLKRVSNGDQD